MKRCSSCDARNPDRNSHCRSCGKELPLPSVSSSARMDTQTVSVARDSLCEYQSGGNRCLAVGDMSPDVPSGMGGKFNPRFYCSAHYWAMQEGDWKKCGLILDDYRINGLPKRNPNWYDEYSARLDAECRSSRSAALTPEDKADWMSVLRGIVPTLGAE